MNLFRRQRGRITVAVGGVPAAPPPPAPVAREPRYGGVVQARDITAESRPVGGGIEAFDTPAALRINAARMDHLATLGLDFRGKRVLDVGAGVGRLAEYLVAMGAEVVCVEARPENVAELRRRYPGRAAYQLDVERDALAALGAFDVVFCYGLLYHLANPIAAITNMVSVRPALLVLETIVADSREPIMRLTDEYLSANQALGGVGCRPSPAFVGMALNRAGFPFVYMPGTPPGHEDFQLTWRDDLGDSRDGHPIRCVFVASQWEIASPELEPLVQ